MLTRSIALLLLACLFCLGAPGPALAQASPAPVAITQLWARATPGSATIGAAYLSMTAPTGDRLVGAASPVATTVELHEHTMQGEVMQMRQVDGIDLPPGKRVTMQPDGYHIMLKGLKQKLVEGQTFPLTLTFEKAGPVQATVKIGKPGASGPVGD